MEADEKPEDSVPEPSVSPIAYGRCICLTAQGQTNP